MSKTIILYYSFTGNSRKEAEKLAQSNPEAVLCEIKEKRKRTMLTAFLFGCPKAMHRRAVPIQPLAYDLSAFERILIVSPIWAGYPVPAFQAVMDQLPAKKEVGLYFCSGGGEEPKSEAGTKELIASKGCQLIEYKDIMTYKPKQK